MRIIMAAPASLWNTKSALVPGAPATATGTEEEIRDDFRGTRDDTEQRVRVLLQEFSQPE